MYETSAGDESLYSIPEVTEGQTQPGVLEKPIHEDVRGSIRRLDIDGTKLNLIYTKKGFMRSGDLHKNTQFDIILSGKVELSTFENGKAVKKVLEENTFIVIHPHVPHLFVFLENTVMAEWWDGPFKAWFYQPYRSIIDKNFQQRGGI